MSDAQNLPGEFVETPSCPLCGTFMSTTYDGQGFPAAKCGRATCNGFLDVDELIAQGYFVEA